MYVDLSRNKDTFAPHSFNFLPSHMSMSSEAGVCALTREGRICRKRMRAFETNVDAQVPNDQESRGFEASNKQHLKFVCPAAGTASSDSSSSSVSSDSDNEQGSDTLHDTCHSDCIEGLNVKEEGSTEEQPQAGVQESSAKKAHCVEEKHKAGAEYTSVEKTDCIDKQHNGRVDCTQDQHKACGEKPQISHVTRIFKQQNDFWKGFAAAAGLDRCGTRKAGVQLAHVRRRDPRNYSHWENAEAPSTLTDPRFLAILGIKNNGGRPIQPAAMFHIWSKKMEGDEDAMRGQLRWLMHLFKIPRKTRLHLSRKFARLSFVNSKDYHRFESEVIHDLTFEN